MLNEIRTVESQTNPLAYLKAIATLVGSIASALLGIYAADTSVGKVLTVISVIATVVATWVIPNALVVPAVTDEGEIVGDGDDEEDPLTYEEAGGLPFPVDADESALYGDGADRGVEAGDTGRFEDRDPNRY